MNKIKKSIQKFSNKLNFQTIQKLHTKKIIFPFYHTISDKPILHLKNLYQIKNIKQFNTDLDFLLKNFTPINLNDLINNISNKKKTKKTTSCFPSTTE